MRIRDGSVEDLFVESGMFVAYPSSPIAVAIASAHDFGVSPLAMGKLAEVGILHANVLQGML